MPNDPDAIRAQLDALKQIFKDQLVLRLDEMDAAWAVPDPAEVHRLAHKLAGTAGTFGQAEISALARKVEHCLVATREGAPLAPADQERVSTLLQSLREAGQK